VSTPVEAPLAPRTNEPSQDAAGREHEQFMKTGDDAHERRKRQGDMPDRSH